MESFGTQDRLDWLRLSRAEGIGALTFHRMLSFYGTARAALDALPELARKRGRKTAPRMPAPGVLEREISALEKLGGRMICACEPTYPLSLAAIDDAPPVLSVLGDPALFSRPCLGIVGARNASLNGRRFAAKLATDLGESGGQVIVSGLARGIDTAAHQGALKQGTIAVVAGGIDHIYPPENAALYDDIRTRGLIVAESPLGQVPFARSFPRRNRIVSGLCSGIIVVEASLRSGSLITARLAAEQGRDVFAVPGFPADPRAQGPNHLIRDGAILIRDAEDVLDYLARFESGRLLDSVLRPAPYVIDDESEDSLAAALFEDEDTPPAEEPARAPARRSSAEDVMEKLTMTPVAVDELARACQLTIAELQPLLVELELSGAIVRHPGNRVGLLGAQRSGDSE